MQEAEVEHHGPWCVSQTALSLSRLPHNEAKVGAFCFQQAAPIVAIIICAVPRRCAGTMRESDRFLPQT
jgi:hypothetical protein